MILRASSIIAVLLATSILTQSRTQSAATAPPAVLVFAPDNSPLIGTWTYRSFNNTVDLVNGDAQKALNLILGEGIFTFALSHAALTGTLDMGDGYVLDLNGVVLPPSKQAPLAVAISGVGRGNTPTAGWQYDYHGYFVYHWPNGIHQAAVLVGTVVRTTSHDGEPAGIVASFIAVKRPQS